MDERPASLVHTESAFYEPDGAKSGSPEPGARSSAGERPLHTRKVVGSKPTAPTTPSRRYQRHLAALTAKELKGESRRGDLATFIDPMVYFVRAERLAMIKIGVTRDIGDRIKTLRVGSPDRLTLLAVIFCEDAKRMESEIHDAFAVLHSHGEWFREAPGLLAFIEAYGKPPPSPIGHFQREVMTRARRREERGAVVYARACGHPLYPFGITEET